MKVITNTTLLIRRIGEVRRRREAIVDRQDRLRGSLPQWALAPLQLVGLTAAEIQGLMSDLSEAEKQAGLEDVERELEQLDQQIEELENLLLTTPSRSLDGIQAVLDMAVTRFRGQTVTDPSDVFYDYGDAPSSFGTLFALDGARHNATGPQLGPLRDEELDATSNTSATGDDTVGSADEDGLVSYSVLRNGLSTESFRNPDIDG